ncbi:hypothetical protein PF010_g3796 [Phytophthora fragariae]|uniref:Uncharacterized protein n=1 Tax=Phytophthora fragariae TaxID=53985 RepID=A0A6G0PL22_9STRA|nr:hypothetical protein PF010_g3796 [Phytophthora fragariae]KAE9249036.1 hypothetical protein PF004_g3572 [Phytophthora fragariae]
MCPKVLGRQHPPDYGAQSPPMHHPNVASCHRSALFGAVAAKCFGVCRDRQCAIINKMRQDLRPFADIDEVAIMGLSTSSNVHVPFGASHDNVGAQNAQ